MSRHHDRLNRWRWASTRRAVLDRDGWRCTRCGTPRQLEVHHVEALADGGDEYDPDGCRVLCRDCHFAAHGKVRRSATPWGKLIGSLET